MPAPRGPFGPNAIGRVAILFHASPTARWEGGTTTTPQLTNSVIMQCSRHTMIDRCITTAWHSRPGRMARLTSTYGTGSQL